MDAGIHSQTEDGVRWCSNCRQLGQKSRLRKFQINFDECIWLCSHAKCPSEVENPSSSSVILKRKASEIPNLRKRRKTAQPVATATVKLANMHHFGSALLLQNEDALCWLDSSILLLVFCESLRECLDDLPGDLSLKWLCREFDNAQKQFQAIYSSGVCVQDFDIRSQSAVIPETVEKTSEKLKSSVCITRYEPVLSESANSLEDSLDLMKFLDEDTSVEVSPVTETGLENKTLLPVPELPVGGNSPVPLPKCQRSKVDSELSEPMSILKDMREKIWQDLQPHLRCEKGQEETPVFALPVLLRHNKHFEAHFETSYHWEFCCRACNFTETTVGKSVMPSLKTVMKPLNMSSPSILRPCYTCNTTNQRSKLIIHSLPACPMFHFIEGIPPVQSWNQLNFIHGGYQYLLSAIIQYKQNPNHFVAWIKDNRRNLWLQGDDLRSPISHWSREEPIIPSSEVHVVQWERQGECKDCSKLHTAAQCIIETDNLDLIKPFHQKEGFSGSLTSNRGSSQSVKMKNYLQTYIPKAGKGLSASASKEIVSVGTLEEKGKDEKFGGNEKENNAKEKNQTKDNEKEKGVERKININGSERSRRKMVGCDRDRLKRRQPTKASDNSETLYTGKCNPDKVLKSIPSRLTCKTRPLPSVDSGATVPPQKAVDKVVQRPAESKSTIRRELSSWVPKMKLVGKNLASKFAFLSESLPSCAEYREKMARNRRRSELSGLSSSFKKSFDGSIGGSMRSLRLGSVSPMSSPSGSSESCSLPDSAGSGPAFQELDDFLDEFLDKHVMPSEMEINGEMSPNFEDFLEALDL